MREIEANSSHPAKQVAIYCRTNHNHLGQNISYLSSIKECENMVISNPDWKLVDNYSEVVKSTIPWQKRNKLNKMIKSCEDGQINLIVTSSFKCFSRSIVDLVCIIQHLKSLNVEIYFQQENIYSTDSNFDIMPPIISSIYQEREYNHE